MTDEPIKIDIQPESSSGSWTAHSPNGAEIELFDPSHKQFSKQSVLAEGSRVHDGQLDDGHELLCFKDDVTYLCRRIGPDQWTIPAALYELDTYEPSAWAVEDCAELGESLLLAEEEREELRDWGVFLHDRRQSGCVWIDFAIGDKVMRVPTPSHSEFDRYMHEESNATSAGSGYGPMTHEHSEGIYGYGGHLFKVSDYDIEPYNPNEDLPDGWIHPLSMMVDNGSGREISIGFDEDNEFEDFDYQELFWDADDDAFELGEGDGQTDDELELFQAKVEARAALEALSIVHNGVDLVGPAASSALPSGEPWVAFTTFASLDEVEAKLFGTQRIQLNGFAGLMSDGVPITVALRLSDEDFVYRLTHDWVEVAYGDELNAFVGRRYRR